MFWLAYLLLLATQKPQQYTVHHVTAPITVDGKLEDAAWSQAPWTTDFVDIEGVNKPKPQFRTRAKILYNDKYLYIAAELEEPHVWATLKEHDSVIFHDNDFEVFIDPDGDTFNYYELEINALGTEWDLFLTKPYRDRGLAINSWEIPGLKKAVHVNGTLNDPRDRDVGWTVELALPWQVLKEAAPRQQPPKPGDTWRLNFSRVEWDVDVANNTYVKRAGPEHNWVWSPQGEINMHAPEHWAYIKFE